MTIYLVDTIEGVRPGLEGHLERVVDGDLLTHHVGGQGTFSTPAMIGLMEITSHRSVERMLPEGHTTVGYEVHVRHLAPTAPGATIEQAKAVLLGSIEYFNTRGGGSNSGFLNALYQDTLGRPIDSGAAAFFAQQLQHGASRTLVAYSVVTSAEADGVVIDAYYQNFLHRASDAGGRGAFVNLLQHSVRDEFVLALFVASDEYFSHV